MDLTILENIVDDVKNKLSQEDLNFVNVYIDNNEWVIVYEFICDQLYEYNVPINRQLYEKIKKFGKLIGVSDNNWLPLQELIVGDENNKSTKDNGFIKTPE